MRALRVHVRLWDRLQRGDEVVPRTYRRAEVQCCTVTTHEFVNGKSIVENLEFADYISLAWLITNGAPLIGQRGRGFSRVTTSALWLLRLPGFTRPIRVPGRTAHERYFDLYSLEMARRLPAIAS